MEQRISIVTLGVSDLEKSQAFYERLGWRRSVKSAQGVAFFQTGGIALVLYPLEDLARDAGIRHDRAGFSGIALSYNTRSRADVDAVIAEAETAGAIVRKQPQEAFWGGYSGSFSDLDGHLWEVAWNPSFPIDPNGNIRLPD